MRNKIMIGLALVSAALLTFDLYKIFMVVPDELNQGAIFRIDTFSTPSATNNSRAASRILDRSSSRC